MSKPAPADKDKDKDKEIGTLIVVILKARNLLDRHTFRKQDVYAQATLSGVQKKTKVEVKGGQHPVWDEEVRFSVSGNSTTRYRRLEVTCFSKEARTDELVGKGSIDITETLQTGEFDDWIPLEVEGAQRGEIYLEMTYFSNAPAPAPAPAPVPVPAAAPPNNKLLASVLASGNLQRRPSKLSPQDRLSRPADMPGSYPGQPVGGPSNGRPQPSAPAQKPSELPALLTPAYGGRTSSGKGQDTPLSARPPEGLGRPAASKPLPTTLRPGPGPGHSPHGHSMSASPPNPGWQGQSPVDNTPNPYIQGPGRTPPQSTTPVPPAHYYPSTTPAFGPQRVTSPIQQQGTPLLWQRPVNHATGPGSEVFSFPAPSVAPAHEPYVAPPAQYYAPAQHPVYYHQQHGGLVQHEYPDERDNLPDPQLIQRYRTPLPLPPGVSRQTAAPGPAPAPAPVPAPAPQPSKPAVSAPRRQEYDARAEALRWEEEEERRRQEQERRDMELAMQLDKELNL